MPEIKFPLVLEDLPQLKRFVRSVTREVFTEVQSLNSAPGAKAFMTKQDCYREAGSRDLVDRAIRNGTLRVRTKEGRRGILRPEFLQWLDTPQEKRRKNKFSNVLSNQ
jgi:hypothetical protein